MTTVKHILMEKGHVVWSVSPHAAVKDALHLLAEKKIGAVLVVEESKILGIFSERDYVRLVANAGALAQDTLVHEVMTHPIYFVTPDQKLEDCMSLMTAKHIRHLPVMESGKLVGLISIGDVVKWLIEDKVTTIKGLENYILGRGFTQ